MRITTEEFIKRSKEIHGDKYDYSKSVYNGNHNKLCIVCPEHGEFWQSPSNHYRNECPYCAGRKMNTIFFVKKAKEVHGDKYDYSKTEYIKDGVKVCIICPEHGEFWQNPNSHLNGNGCPYCAGNFSNNDFFIKKAKQVHGDKYDYSKVEYKNNITPVAIICKKHGVFYQKPREHLDGCGCQICGLEKRIHSSTDTYKDFVEKAIKKHGYKYDYSYTEYKTARNKVLIKCPIHGIFSQEAFSHLSGCGCPKCSNIQSKAEDEITDFIKTITIEPVERNRRDVIKPQEIDIYLPISKIGIEYNGLIWHSDKFKNDKNYHYNKMIECELPLN